MFQSAPAIAGGRCTTLTAGTTGTTSFNPRPPLLAGDAGELLFDADAVVVSIRARHCWRAMPWITRHPVIGAVVSIRARHCWRAMPVGFAPASNRPAFQSAPAIAGGRCPGLVCRALVAVGFNPRPPLLAGDASPSRYSFCCCGVSIRARHCWRAMLFSGVTMTALAGFQSAPAIAGGRCSASR